MSKILLVSLATVCFLAFAGEVLAASLERGADSGAVVDVLGSPLTLDIAGIQ